MFTRRLAPLLLVFVILPCVAQRGGGGTVNLQLMIVLDGERQPYNKEITVTVFDGWGVVEQALTVKQGMVEFFIPPGVHRLSIAGPEIEQYYDEFNLDLEPARMRTIQVEPKRKLTTKQHAEGTVASVRLNIPKKAEKEFERAQNAWKKKKWSDAKTHLQNAISIYPQYDAAYAALGAVELQMGEREDGRRDLQKAIQLNRNNTPACRRLAELSSPKIITSQQNRFCRHHCAIGHWTRGLFRMLLWESCSRIDLQTHSLTPRKSTLWPIKDLRAPT